jgi:DNA-binding HxlR family transcriptional regulator
MSASDDPAVLAVKPEASLAPGAPEIKVPGQCPMDSVLRQLMGPWTTYILWLLRTEGPLRFGALKSKVPGISSKMLTERLRHLEASRLVHRDYQPTIPPAVTYSLTVRGSELHGVLDGLGEIAVKWAAEDAARPGAEPGSMLN